MDVASCGIDMFLTRAMRCVPVFEYWFLNESPGNIMSGEYEKGTRMGVIPRLIFSNIDRHVRSNITYCSDRNVPRFSRVRIDLHESMES